ncbi:MAG: hypothetical protein JWP82_2214 [Humibacillus sp.]|nr:hypothetical protein [Humibacillus sp.]
MARNLLCLILGHRWHREHRTGKTILTCKRCGTIDVLDKERFIGL